MKRPSIKERLRVVFSFFVTCGKDWRTMWCGVHSLCALLYTFSVVCDDLTEKSVHRGLNVIPIGPQKDWLPIINTFKVSTEIN